MAIEAKAFDNLTVDALIGEAMVLDFTREELRAAFEENLAKWKDPKGGDRNDE